MIEINHLYREIITFTGWIDNKIREICNNFNEPKVGPIKILEMVCQRPVSTFSLPFISVPETKQLLLKQKNSSSKGYDAITNKILRKLAPELAPIVAHLINSIIRTGIFPDNLKISRIIPILKPNKLEGLPDSYRPINCLNSVEKAIEEWIKYNLETYFENNNILNPNHHGGRKGHSPVTAKATLDHILEKNYEANLATCILSTDLSSAFDTIDHKMLGQKLKFYGINGIE